MLDTLDQHLIKNYLSALRRELAVRGVKTERIDEIVAETQIHLEEAMAAAAPQTEHEVRAVFLQFGDAAALARRLAAEYDRISARRRYLWPAAFVVVAHAALHGPFLGIRLFEAPKGSYAQGGLWIGSVRVLPVMWIGTIFLLASAAVLFGMGCRARKPLLGQFAAVIAGLIVVQTAWYAAASYPVAYGLHRQPEFYQMVPRDDVARQLVVMQKGIGAERRVGQRLELGQKVFSAANATHAVPAELMYHGRYWLPEGVREATIGVNPVEINPYLLVSTWEAAVAGWTEHNYGSEGQADSLIRTTPENVEFAQYSFDYLNWIRKQPLSVQLIPDFRTAVIYSVVPCALAIFATNAGWLAWLLVRALGRLRRRIAYRSGLRLAGND